MSNLSTHPRARILMCAPEHFEVSYTINPWMKPDTWRSQAELLGARSNSGWKKLTETLRGLGAELGTSACLEQCDNQREQNRNT